MLSDPSNPTRLSLPTQLGNWQVSELINKNVLNEVYAATGPAGAASIWLARYDLPAAAIPGLSTVANHLATTNHNVTGKILEVGRWEGHVYLVCPKPPGHSLRELLARRSASGHANFGMRATVNLILQVISALTAMSPVVVHGALSSDNIFVGKDGTVMVLEWGLTSLVPAAKSAAPTTWAPEVIASGTAHPRSDVYSLAVLLVEALSGKPLTKTSVQLSELCTEWPASLDKIITRCLQAEPGARPSISELRDVLSKLGQGGSVSNIALSNRPSLAGALASGELAAVQSTAPRAKLSASLTSTEEKWLIEKQRMEYGPYSMVQIVDKIKAGQFLLKHVIIDQDTGNRCTIEDHPLLSEVAQNAKQSMDDARRANAEVAHAVTEKRRHFVLYGGIALALTVVGLGGFFLWSKLSHDKQTKSGAISALASGSIEAKMTFLSKEERKARRAAKRPAASGGGQRAAVPTDDDSTFLDMGAEGGDERLDDSQVNAVLQDGHKGLGRCLTSTATRNATVDFVIRGTGKVSTVKVNGATSSPVAGCVRNVLQGLQFPKFDGQRSRHTFDMNY